jgi:hypothetical protein
MRATAKVFQAGPPLEGKWVLMWRAPVMAAPAFWYFGTREEAEEAARLLDRAAFRRVYWG